jgi:PAS domain S-box-containing protein
MSNDRRSSTLSKALGGLKAMLDQHRSVTNRPDTTIMHEAEDMASIRLAAIVDSSDDAIIGKDLNSIITSWNKGAEKIFGYAAGEMVGTSIMRLIPPDRQDEENHILGRIKNGERVEHFETLRQTKDGRMINVSVTASPITEASGRVVGVSKVARDITGRKRADEAHRTSEARLNFALQTSHIGAWELSLRDNTAHRTLIHDRIFGYDTLLPLWSYEMFLEHVLPDDRAEVNQSFLRARAAGGDWNFECRIRRADGEIRWIWAAGGHERDAEGKAVRMSGIVQDITERKRIEEELRIAHEKLRQLLAHSPVVIYTLKIIGQTITPVIVSDNMERLLGYTVEESSHYDWWANSLHPEDRDRVLAIAGPNSLRNGYTVEYRLRHKDGTYRWVQDNNRTALDSSQQKEAVGVLIDITERKKADEEIQNQLHELQRWHEAMLGREERLLELKREVNELLVRQDSSPRYSEAVTP